MSSDRKKEDQKAKKVAKKNKHKAFKELKYEEPVPSTSSAKTVSFASKGKENAASTSESKIIRTTRKKSEVDKDDEEEDTTDTETYTGIAKKLEEEIEEDDSDDQNGADDRKQTSDRYLYPSLNPKSKTFFADLMQQLEQWNKDTKIVKPKPVIEQDEEERKETMRNIRRDLRDIFHNETDSIFTSCFSCSSGEDYNDFERRLSSIKSRSKTDLASAMHGKSSIIEDRSTDAAWLGPIKTNIFQQAKRSFGAESASKFFCRRSTWYSDEAMEAAGANLKDADPNWLEEKLKKLREEEAAQIESGAIPISDDALKASTFSKKTQHVLTLSHLRSDNILKGFEMSEIFHEKFKQFSASADIGMPLIPKPLVEEKTISIAGIERWLEVANVLDHKKLTVVHVGFCFIATKPDDKERITVDEFLIFLGKISRLRKEDISEIIKKLTSCPPPDNVSPVKSPRSPLSETRLRKVSSVFF